MIEGHDYTIDSGGPGGRSRMYALLALSTAFLTPVTQHGLLVLLRRYFGDDWDIAETALFFGGFTTLVLFGVLINLFDAFLWRTRAGTLMFRAAGLSAPPDLSGEYRGTIEVHPRPGAGDVFHTEYTLRIVQTWEQISLLAERLSEGGSPVRVHSDMANLRVGMASGVVTLRFVYTFEESLPRRDGTGLTARHFSGAGVFEFVRSPDGWTVTGHFFDDIGRSGELRLRQPPPAV